MLTCNGFKMFYGTVLVTPAILPDGTRWREPFDMTGTWLYDPDTACWYCKPDGIGLTHSFAPSILSDFREQCMMM